MSGDVKRASLACVLAAAVAIPATGFADVAPANEEQAETEYAICVGGGRTVYTGEVSQFEVTADGGAAFVDQNGEPQHLASWVDCTTHDL